MEIVISALGTKGDIYPLVGVGRLLVQRGYHVTFFANEVFKDVITASSINFQASGSEIDYKALHSDGGIWNGEKNVFTLGYHSYFLPAWRKSYKYISNAYHEKRKVFVLTLDVIDGASIAADELGIPRAIIVLSPKSIFSVFDPPAPACWRVPKCVPDRLRPTYFRLRRLFLGKQGSKKPLKRALNDLAVPEVNHKSVRADLYGDQLIIGMFPDWFSPPQLDWPKGIKLVGFPLFDEVKKAGRKIIDDFLKNNEPPLVFTTGTGVFDVDSIFREGRKICELLRTPGVFVGAAEGKKHLKDSNLCLHIDYVDFEYLLSKAKLIIHHGGIGTTAQAIRAGIPQLLRPLAFDQADNANRIHKLNLGTIVFPEYFRAEEVAKTILTMTENSPHVKELEMYAIAARRSNALQLACDHIEHRLSQLT